MAYLFSKLSGVISVPTNTAANATDEENLAEEEEGLGMTTD